MPGIVAFCVPIFWAWRAHGMVSARPAGLALVCGGSLGLLWCVRDFYVKGKGTLAPWAPPRQLVVVGLYRYSRNPMYVCVVAILVGWAVTFASWGLALYAIAIAAAFQLRVVLGEEPWLADTHGDAWAQYVRRVPRWIRLGVLPRTDRQR